MLVNITLHIAGRDYSLQIDPEQEDLLREAARMVNQRIKDKREQFRTPDKLSLLSMVAFDMAVETLNEQKADDEAAARLAQLERKIAAAS